MVPAHAHHHRLLIVDDEEALLASMCDYFSLVGYITDGASSYDETMDCILTHHYDAVITDVMLSGSDSTEGLDILARLKTETPSTPVVVITAHDTQQMRRLAESHGADRFFAKPFQLTEMLETIQALSENRKPGP